MSDDNPIWGCRPAWMTIERKPKSFRMTSFRKKVLNAWFDLGRNATSTMITDQIFAKSETKVSKAMDILEANDIGPLMRSAWVPYKSRQVIVNVHSPTRCKGKSCPVHNITDHHMKEWPQNFRSDRGITERICPHGIGHPDPDDINAKGSNSVHGCDGCCRKRKK
jgi:hypothetical protein